MKKIGVDIRTLMDSHYSGIPFYTFNLLNNLLDLDDRNKYHFFYNSYKDQTNNFLLNKENVEIKKTGYPNKIFNYVLQKTLKRPKIDKLLPNPDVFWTPHINFLNLSSDPVKFLTIHDLSFLRYPHFFNLRKNFWHYMLNIRKLVKQFDYIITVSHNSKNDIIELLDFSPERVIVIPSGIGQEYKPLDIPQDKKTELRKKYNLPDKFFLYLGNIEPRKNVDTLIEAYEIFRQKYREHGDYKLVIAGAKTWKFSQVWKKWRNSPARDHIYFAGYIDEADKPYLYNLSEVFLYISYYEGFGFPPLEAMSCGVPVISSFTSSLPEVVGGSGLLIDPYNPESLAPSLKKIITDNKLRQKFIHKGLEKSQNFSWKESAKQYKELFENYDK